MRNWRLWFTLGTLFWWTWVVLEAHFRWRVCSGFAGPWLASGCGHPYRTAFWLSLLPVAALGLSVWLRPLVGALLWLRRSPHPEA